MGCDTCGLSFAPQRLAPAHLLSLPGCARGIHVMNAFVVGLVCTVARPCPQLSHLFDEFGKVVTQAVRRPLATLLQ